MAHSPKKIDYLIQGLSCLRRKADESFEATSNDPSIFIKLCIANDILEESDCHIRMVVVVEARSERVSSELYLPSENGYNQSEAIERSFASGEIQEYIIHRKYSDGILRYDPHNAIGGLKLRFLAFHAWSAKASFAVLLGDYLRRSYDPTVKYGSGKYDGRNFAHPSCTFDALYATYLATTGEPLTSPYSIWAKYIEKSSIIKHRKAKITNSSIKFSLLTPVYNTNPVFLRECVDSVLSQAYQNWELCLVDDKSSREDTINTLKEIATLDDRIKVIFRETNGHICQATNDALKIATGDRICFLDHDDTLAQHALQSLAEILSLNPGLSLIYSDEDFLDLCGNRTSPHFKSDWNRHLLYSHNYITHFVCVDSELVRSLGGLREGTEGAQDYDFLLRLSGVVNDNEVYHIPEILYHWRISETSTASSTEAKPYTVNAGKKALNDFFASISENVQIYSLEQSNFYCSTWNIPKDSSPKVSIIIPTRNQESLLRQCVESIIEKSTYRNFEILIVDNGSDDSATIQYLHSLAMRPLDIAIKVLEFDVPFNYSRINNYASTFAAGDLLCLLNNDTEVIEPRWMEIMAGHAIRPGIGCVGAKLLYADDTIQHAGVILSLGGYAGHSHKGLPNRSPGYFMRPHLMQEVSAVTGACLMIRSHLFKEINGLDEFLFPVAYNDLDLCLKLGAIGLRNLYVPAAVLYHHESKSRGFEDTPLKIQRFTREKANLKAAWGQLLDEDFCYNPNLTKDREDFSLRLC
jgi:O-antigen biosynthesis protein